MIYLWSQKTPRTIMDMIVIACKLSRPKVDERPVVFRQRIAAIRHAAYLRKINVAPIGNGYKQTQLSAGN